MSSVYVKTPLLRHVFTPGKRGMSPQFFLKYEFFQPSGSFKSRGIGHLIKTSFDKIVQEGTKSPYVFASSGGNAGLAAATASQQLNIPCTVVVPTATRQRMVEKIKDTGADVIVYGSHWKEADGFLRSTIIPRIDETSITPIYAHPFDHPTTWEGHSFMIDEIIESLKEYNVNLDKLKGIVCSVGGGGLYNGLIQGLERYNLANKIPILGVETKGCETLYKSLKAGRTVELEKITSIATSLCTANISEKTFENVLKYKTKSTVLEDVDVLETCLKFANDTNIIPEPACGATLHFGYHVDMLKEYFGDMSSDDIVVLIGCGGSSTTFNDLKDMLEKMKPSTMNTFHSLSPHIHPVMNATFA